MFGLTHTTEGRTACNVIVVEDQSCKSWTILTKGLSQVLGLTFVYKYSQLKPEIWVRPLMNTAPGQLKRIEVISHYVVKAEDLCTFNSYLYGYIITCPL